MRFFQLGLMAALLQAFIPDGKGYTQTIGSFNSIQPTAQTENLVLPSTHTFQRIIHTGDALSAGGTLGVNLDFTGFVPIAGSSTNGYLSISSEAAPAECAVLSVSLNAATKTWNVNNGGKVNFPPADLGAVAAFCSGTVTPKGTILVCEETVFNIDNNADGYQDLGWVVEIDPVTRTVLNQDVSGGVDKLWAMGRQVHENVAIKADQSVLYWGADADPNGYVYKFVPNATGNYSSGSLYVLQTSVSLGTGSWQLINNTTQADCNNTAGLSTAVGAYNFKGIEDVEIGPDGKIYFCAKIDGVIYRFRDLGTTVDQLEVFVSSTNYDVDDAGPFAPEPWGRGNDNLAFDGEGNLWVLQDGDRNHIWVVSPSHTAATPAIKLFATTPLGSEPTGITFTPDYKFMFLSFQHPFGSNSSSQMDAADATVTFNTHTTVVIGRKEFLGSSALPVKFSAFHVSKANRAVEVAWTVEAVSEHSYFDIERSTDGTQFSKIYSTHERISDAGKSSFTFLDDRLPASDLVYYRIKQCDLDGSCMYSSIRMIRVSSSHVVQVYPVPVSKTLHIEYTSTVAATIEYYVLNTSGYLMHRQKEPVPAGKKLLHLETDNWPAGNYLLIIKQGAEKTTVPFTKVLK